jgi:transcriptional regulator with XRE-family HTH domain
MILSSFVDSDRMSTNEDYRGGPTMSETSINHWTKLGSAVRDARTRRRWSQHELAERAGVSRSWLARLEAGHRGAELEQIFRLLTALDMTLTVRDTNERYQLASDANETRTTARAESGTSPTAAQRAAVSALQSAHESSASARRRAWSLATHQRDRGSPDPTATSESDSVGRS